MRRRAIARLRRTASRLRRTASRLCRTAGGLAALLGLATGCAGDGGRVEATTVLTYNQCRALEAGLTRVSYDQVAAIRGNTLLGMTAGAAPGDGAPDAPATSPPEKAAAQSPLMVAISRGRQPTPGYSLTLEGAHRRGRTAVVSVQWHVPKPGAVLAQVITYPCLVVALPQADFRRVEAVDQSGALLGSLDL